DIDTTSEAGDGLWIADYVTAGEPRVEAARRFHQYTDDPLDRHVADFADEAALREWAEGAGGPRGAAEAGPVPGVSPGTRATPSPRASGPGPPRRARGPGPGGPHLLRWIQNSSNDRSLSPFRSREAMIASATSSVTFQSPPWASAVLN